MYLARWLRNLCRQPKGPDQLKMWAASKAILLGANYGPGAVEAVKAAAASHPLVAKILMHGLEYAGAMKVANVLHVFDGKQSIKER